MDKSALLSNRVELNTDTVPIEGVGEVTVRGLSRYELLLSEKIYPDDRLKQERWILSTAVLDPAGLTESDVEVWQKNSLPMEINSVARRINELSGIAQGAAKSDVPADGERTGV